MREEPPQGDTPRLRGEKVGDPSPRTRRDTSVLGKDEEMRRKKMSIIPW